MSGPRVAIAGAGLAGALLAILLGRRGLSVDVYERRPDPRHGAGGRSRSINLAISTRGLHALHAAGLEKKILEIAVPMRGRMIHKAAGPLSFQPYGTNGEAINSISRAALNTALIEAAERDAGVRFHFDRRVAGLDPARGRLALEAPGGQEETEADVVVGADGANSEVRRRLQREDRFELHQTYLEHGYKELTIPAAAGGGFAMEPHALHIWPRASFMMIALPNRDGSFTCTCFWPFTGPGGFDALRSPADVRAYFEQVFPDAVPLMPTLVADYLENPVGSLVTIRCRPWHRGRAVLLGDAAHAVVPFYGQGANASFEDCLVLADAIVSHAPDWSRGFAEYEARRREHTDALAQLAIDNFIEMRDKTASRAFRAGKKLEHGLARLLPFWFRPLYGMVTFSLTPYADAVRRARRQWSVVRRVALAALVLALAAAAAVAWAALS